MCLLSPKLFSTLLIVEQVKLGGFELSWCAAFLFSSASVTTLISSSLPLM